MPTARRPSRLENRRRAERKGRLAEAVAALFLQLKGYRVLARRVRTKAGEIDLVVRRGNVLVFVEVKARHTLDSGVFALHPATLQRIGSAARVLAPRFLGRCTTTRIDAVVVRPWAVPVHMVAVWRGVG